MGQALAGSSSLLRAPRSAEIKQGQNLIAGRHMHGTDRAKQEVFYLRNKFR